MYKRYFELDQEPFRITPDVQSFFTGGDRGAILRALVYAICAGDGIIKLVGEVGSGKTMLCRMLEQYLPQNVDIAYIANPRLTPDNILQTIAFELELPLSSLECNNRVLMLGVLQNYLVKAHTDGRQVVVLVEEAQSIPIETLEEIRLLSNIETSQHKLLQIVLFGQPELDEILQTKSIRQITERIANSFYLQPLTKNEVFEYLKFRLFSAGYRGSGIISSAASKLITRHSNGLLRKINILAEKSLLAAWQDDSRIVRKTHVNQALQDFSYKKDSSITKKMVYAGTLSLLLTLSLGLVWSNLSNKKLSALNLLPAAQAGAFNTNHKTPTALTQRKLSVLSKTIAGHSLKTASESLAFTNKLAQSRIWLNKLDPSHFTIQVLLTNADVKDELLQVFSAYAPSVALNKLYFFRTNLRGNPMIEVLYGDYASYSAARIALKSLPELLQKYQPYIRNIGTVTSIAITKRKYGNQGM